MGSFRLNDCQRRAVLGWKGLLIICQQLNPRDRKWHTPRNCLERPWSPSTRPLFQNGFAEAVLTNRRMALLAVSPDLNERGCEHWLLKKLGPVAITPADITRMTTMNRKQAPAITWLTTLALLVSMCASLTFSQRAAAQSNQEAKQTKQIEVSYPVLSRYAADLTLLALQGKLEKAVNHDADVARVIASLSAMNKVPVVVSESDLDRDAIARGVAIKIAFGDVPANLRDRRVFRLSIDALARGARTSDEFAARVQAVFAEAEQAAGRVIVFVDQLHQYAGARATAVASATVKQAIEANHLRIIGGASPEAYASYIASDQNVATLFESISIDRIDTASATGAKSRDKRRSPINEEFEGEKISSDMRELMKSAGPAGRVTAILQVSDVNSKEVRSLLARYGVLASDNL